MFSIPEKLLNNLKCTICDGYLSAKPVMVKNGFQICAKCYKILPQSEKQQCVNQVSYEELGNCFIFPCRYHRSGCNYTFPFNNENDHEAQCAMRRFTYPDIITINKKPPDDKSRKNASNEYCSNEFLPLYVQDQENIPLVNIKKNSNAEEFSLDTDDTHEVQNYININKEGTEFNNNDVASTRTYENIYNSIPIYSKSVEYKKCLNCQALIEKQFTNTCLFGHVTCNNCKQDMCVACVKNIDGTSRIACKNAFRGCTKILLQTDVGFHRDNCKYNLIACPINQCSKKDITVKLKEHLIEDHQDQIVQNTEETRVLGQTDKTIIFLCYDGIFKYSYFYYGSTVEMFMVYLGPCVEASQFSLEISIEVNKKTINKKMGCANWNDCMLASGITFNTTELKNTGVKKINFTVNLKIIKAKERH